MFRIEIDLITGKKIEIPVSPEEIIVNLEQGKKVKIDQLRMNRDLENDKDFLISIMLNNQSCTFRIKKSDSETLQRRINKLINANLLTSVWTDVDGFRRELTLAQFQDLKRTFDNHLNDRDAEIYSHYFEAKDAINNASTLEELNAINTDF